MRLKRRRKVYYALIDGHIVNPQAKNLGQKKINWVILRVL